MGRRAHCQDVQTFVLLSAHVQCISTTASSTAAAGLLTDSISILTPSTCSIVFTIPAKKRHIIFHQLSRQKNAAGGNYALSKRSHYQHK